jgi:hypothetical protein
MNSEKVLYRSLNALLRLFDELAVSSASIEGRESFLSAKQQCNIIITAIQNNETQEAKSKWRILMHYADDSIGGSELFLEKYQPLKQKIINAGLQ